MHNPNHTLTDDAVNRKTTRRRERDRHGAFRRWAARRVDALLRDQGRVTPSDLVAVSPDTPGELLDIAGEILDERTDLYVTVRPTGARIYRAVTS